MEQKNEHMLPELFYNIILQSDSFIQMRDLITQLSPSFIIPEYIFNTEYNGNGKLSLSV